MQTSKIHRNSTVAPNQTSYIWKMIRKIQSIHMYHFHACLSNLCLLIRSNQLNGIWVITYGVWIWILYSDQLHLIVLLVALAQSTAYCHDIIMHHNCCIALIVFLLYCRWLSPLDRRCTDAVIVDTDEDSMLSSEVPGKQNPLAHSDTIPLSRSCSLLLH